MRRLGLHSSGVHLVVILVTLLVQGLTLPAVVRWAHLPEDPTEADEERRAESAASRAGLAAIPPAADRLRVPDHLRDQVLAEYRARAERAQAEHHFIAACSVGNCPRAFTARR